VNVLWFLEKRVTFLRQLYETASLSYLERKAKIERQEEPYVPPYSEDPEPSFLSEWLEADESLQALGHFCLSMLAASLNLYFKAWEREAGYPIEPSLKSAFKNSGWLRGYQLHFRDRLGVDIEAGPVEFNFLHEVVLARNRIQHQASIVQSRPTFSASDLQKVKHPFFLNESERDLFNDPETNELQTRWLLEPSVHVTPEKLFATLDSVLEFAQWFDRQVSERLHTN